MKPTISNPFRNLVQHLASGFLCMLLLQTMPVAAQQAKAATAGSSAASNPSGPSNLLTPTKTLKTPIDSGPIDAIVALVNNDIITQSELQRQVLLVETQMKKRNVTPPARAVLRTQVLERMVLDRAQLQLAQSQGLQIDEAQIDNAIARIAEQGKQSVSTLLNDVASQGMSEAQFRQEIRQELLIARLREREVDNKIQISDSEVESFIQSRLGSNANATPKPEVNWTHIFIKVPATASSSEKSNAQATAKRIEGLLKSNQSFADISKSIPSIAVEGTGPMGWQQFDEIPTLFTEFLTKAQPQSVQTIASPNGLHVLQVNEHRIQNTLDNTPITQTRARHILIRPGPDLSPEQAKQRIEQVALQLRMGQTGFDALAKRYSQDGSAAKGGDLGWLYPGDTVPEFERELNKLKPNEISPVFESRFGLHIVQVLERRQQAATETRQKQMAKIALRNLRAEEAYGDWLKQLRDRTYVDIRLPQEP